MTGLPNWKPRGKNNVRKNQASVESLAWKGLGPRPSPRYLRSRLSTNSLDSTSKLSGQYSGPRHRGHDLAATRGPLRLRILYYPDCAGEPETRVGRPMTTCNRPPEGWACSRKPGHDGPCAARPEGPVVRIVPFLGGYIVFCRDHTYVFSPPKKRPWYNRLWRKFKRWLSPPPPIQIPRDVGYKFKYEFFNSKTGERTDVTPSFERTNDPTNPA